MNKLTLRAAKNRRYLTFIPDGYAYDRISLLGFEPIKVDGATLWQKAFHPALVSQVQNLFPDVTLDVSLQKELERYALSNYITASFEPIDDDDDMKDYQRDATKFLSTKKRAMLALAPGLGKTLCALRAAEAAGHRKICAVAPLSLLYNWKREVQRWLPQSRVGIVHSGSALDAWGRGPRKIIITNYETFQGFRASDLIGFNLIIFDESVLLKNRKTKRFKVISDKLKGFAGAVWELSGGPTTKYLDDMWAQLYLLDRSRFSSYWQFAHHYCIIHEDQWGAHILDNRPGAHELLRKDIGDIYFARTQDEVADLPPWIFDRIDVPMEADQASLYQQMEKEFLAVLPSGDEVLATNVLVQLLRLVQIASNSILLDDVETRASSAKWDTAIDILEYCEHPVIIWTSFKRTACILYGLLQKKYGVDVLTGEVKSDKRSEIVRKFQAGDLDVLIAHPGVGKFGHTLTAARTAIYVERRYSGDDSWQSLHRVRRIGTKQRPRIIYLLSTCNGKKTVDHAIDKVLEAKRASNIAVITSSMLRDTLGKEVM